MGCRLGVIQAAVPLGFWWDPTTVYALSLALIAGTYIGFAVADGRARVIAVETVVAATFVMVGAAGGAHGDHAARFRDRFWLSPLLTAM